MLKPFRTEFSKNREWWVDQQETLFGYKGSSTTIRETPIIWGEDIVSTYR